jgi:hypothetical protein
MFAFNPGVNDMSGQILGQAVVGAARTNADANVKLTQDIGNALVSIAGAYGKYQQGKTDLAGMDKSVNAMADIGAITTDFRDKYMNADKQTRPFLFQSMVEPMFKSYNAGQSAAAQAQAWDKYKKTWGGAAGGQPDGFTY